MTIHYDKTPSFWEMTIWLFISGVRTLNLMNNPLRSLWPTLEFLIKGLSISTKDFLMEKIGQNIGDAKWVNHKTAIA